MIQRQRTLAEVSEVAIRALVRELGAADAVRFLRQFRRGSGNYTQEREATQRDWTVKTIASEIKQLRGA
jgi:hypothetical protein